MDPGLLSCSLILMANLSCLGQRLEVAGAYIPDVFQSGNYGNHSLCPRWGFQIYKCKCIGYTSRHSSDGQLTVIGKDDGPLRLKLPVPV